MKRKLFYNPTYLIIIIIVINIISYFLFIRIDLTANKKYSLSPVSKSTIKEIDQNITVDLYMSKGLNQEYIKLGKEFKYLLKEYKSLCNKSFTINTIIPDTREKEAQATEAGIQIMVQETKAKDMVKIQKVFFGAVIKIGNTQGTIPLITSHTPIEYEITRILKETCDTLKPTIGFLRGHKEKFNSINQVYNELYSVAQIQPMYIDPFTNLNDFKVICIIGPEERFLPQEIHRLEEYLEKGGRLFIALNHAVSRPGYNNQHTGFINRVGLEDMLEYYGLKINYDFVVDRNCDKIALVSDQSTIQFRQAITFPYYPIIRNFSKHIITKGLNAISLKFASSMENVKKRTAYTFTSLAKTSSTSGVQEVPVFFNLMKTWTRQDFNSPNNTVAALLNNEYNKSAIIVVSDAEFMQNNTYENAHYDNINFAVNSIEWLADDSGLINLRNKFIIDQTLDPINDASRIFLKYLNFLLPVLIILLGGAIIYRQNKIKRLRRSQPGCID